MEHSLCWSGLVGVDASLDRRVRLGFRLKYPSFPSPVPLCCVCLVFQLHGAHVAPTFEAAQAYARLHYPGDKAIVCENAAAAFGGLIMWECRDSTLRCGEDPDLHWDDELVNWPKYPDWEEGQYMLYPGHIPVYCDHTVGCVRY